MNYESWKLTMSDDYGVKRIILHIFKNIRIASDHEFYYNCHQFGKDFLKRLDFTYENSSMDLTIEKISTGNEVCGMEYFADGSISEGITTEPGMRVTIPRGEVTWIIDPDQNLDTGAELDISKLCFGVPYNME